MYNNIPNNDQFLQSINNLNRTLAILSFGDAKHDFKFQRTEFEKIMSNFNTGLPFPSNSILDEDDCLKAILDLSKGKDINVEVSDTDYDKKYEGKLTTINNNIYDIKAFRVGKPSDDDNFQEDEDDDEDDEENSGDKKKYKLITAKEFYDKSGFDNTNNNNNIGIVIDAAAVSFLKILKTGPPIKEKNVYYIYGPEVENDPATKKSVYHPIFEKKNGINLIPCVPNNPPDFVYDYSYESNLDQLSKENENIQNVLYLDQFFTKYNFNLSELKIDGKGRSISYTTDLNVSYNEFLNELTNSKKKNSAPTLKNYLKQFIDIFSNKSSKKSNDNEDNFYMNCAFQQKRSGDWLQVLLCAALNDKSRAFKKIGDSNYNITRNIDSVYLVTHDRIALAFALLNGINVIYTHGQTYSVKIYTIQNRTIGLNEEEIQKIDDENNFGWLKEKINKINDLLPIFTTQSELYTQYNKNYNTFITDKNQELMNKLNELNNNNQNAINWNDLINNTFDNQTKNIFSNCFELILSKGEYPDLKTQYNDIIGDIEKLNGILKLNPNYTTLDLNGFIDLLGGYEKYKVFYLDVEKMYSCLKNMVAILNNKSKNFNNNFADNENLRLIKNWKWQIEGSQRIWTKYEDIASNKSSIFLQSRNAFLYSLNNLSNPLKKSIVSYYKSIYNQLKTLNESDLSTRKFKAVANAFCIEVILALGFDDNNDKSIRSEENMKALINNPNNKNIIDLIDNYIINNSTINNSSSSSNPIQPNPYLNYIGLVSESNAFNQLVKNNDYQSSLINSIDERNNEMDVNDSNANQTTNNAKVNNVEITPSQSTRPILSMITSCTKYVSKISRSVINISRGRRNNQPVNVIQGGGGPNKMDDLIQFTTLYPVEDEKEDVIQDANLLCDTSICFHPLLPIYIINEALYSTINNEDINDSLDKQVFYNVFQLLVKMKDNINELLSEKNNVNVLYSYIIGLGIREIFFQSKANDKNLFNSINKIDYSLISSLISSLSYSYSGFIIPSLDQNKVLETNIFKNFCQKITIDKQSNEQSSDILNENVFNLSTEICEKILLDTNYDEMIKSQVNYFNEIVNTSSMTSSPILTSSSLTTSFPVKLINSSSPVTIEDYNKEEEVNTNDEENGIFGLKEASQVKSSSTPNIIEEYEKPNLNNNSDLNQPSISSDILGKRSLSNIIEDESQQEPMDIDNYLNKSENFNFKKQKTSSGGKIVTKKNKKKTKKNKKMKRKTIRHNKNKNKNKKTTRKNKRKNQNTRFK
jgi:hypothetical protein